MQCSNCGHALTPGSEFCGNCGAKLLPAPTTNPINNTPDYTNNYQAQPRSDRMQGPQQQITANNNAHAIAKHPSNGPSIAALVLGILTLTLFWMWFLAIPLGIAAVITGIIGLSKGGKGMAIAGLITGIIGLLLTILLVVIFVVILNSGNSNTYNKYEKPYIGSSQVIPGRSFRIPKIHIPIERLSIF